MEKIQFSDAKYYTHSLYGLVDIEKSITSLIAQACYLDEYEKQQLISCCFFAAIAHEGQRRRSGEPYICHPIKVAEILAKDVQFDLPVLQGAILHDVIEDTDVGKDAIAEAFSDEVATMVDGVSKLEKDKNVSPHELQARTFAKLVDAMEADPRVVMIKLADRMHNMTTLDALRPDKRKRIALETLHVYVPIASRLGMFVFKSKLQELAFAQLHPWRYRVVKKIVQDTYPQREITFTRVKESLGDYLNTLGVNVSIRKRKRNLFEVYSKFKKHRSNRRPLQKASIPLVVIADDTDACYRVLGAIHQLYAPVANKLVDYIASPKSNGYQSIHTTVISSDRRVINFQIRSKEMHAVAESGIIAIWREHNKLKADAEQPQRFKRRDKSMRRWLGNIKNISTMASDPVEFYEMVKRELISSEIQVFTPKGDAIALPEGATVIDFAYHIHTELGNQLESAQVNGVDVPLDYCLSQGQSIEVTAGSNGAPQCSWLNVIKTARARTAIRHFLRDLSLETLEQLGYQEIQDYLQRHGDSYHYLREMLSEIAEQRQMDMSELLGRIAMHEVKYRTIRTELQALAYKRGITSKIDLNLTNKPGVLAAIADIIGMHKANVVRINLPDDMQASTVSVSFVVHLQQAEHVEPIILALSQLSAVNDINHKEVTE